jgi:topoisomerase-4 subunit B
LPNHAALASKKIRAKNALIRLFPAKNWVYCCAMSDLFANNAARKAPSPSQSYTAEDIEVLEGLEPVRRRPGMYIGGKDENAMHHLVNEVFDNAMDEAVAGHATRIEIELHEDNVIKITDNGRGIPIDPHPKFPKLSALEVILTTLHAGGKFSGKAYATSGGLHGVGISVVNALSDALQVDVAKNGSWWRQQYSQGHPQTKLENVGSCGNRKGTHVTFHPDPEIFGDKAQFRPDRLYRFARSKAYLYRGVEIRWSCAPSLLEEDSSTPAQDTLHFPNGLADYMEVALAEKAIVTPQLFSGEAELADGKGRVEWAVSWTQDEDSAIRSYCNTIQTPDGGTHEAGLRSALVKGVRHFGELAKNKRAANVTADDVLGGAVCMLSLFLRDPQFQGQTKDKLVSAEATRLVENAIRDRLDLWLSGNTAQSQQLLSFLIDKAEERLRRKQAKDVNRKALTQRLRLPGKLADCTRSDREGSELFLVEGDSAGGSAKQARNRETQAILPLRGKILNVASATGDKIRANQEISDLELALGCGTGKHYSEANLRYDKVIIMTDADVDGAHIASLLMTYFYKEMPQLIRQGHLYLAQPPLYRITQGDTTYYANDDASKDALVEKLQKESRKKLEIGRFKGLGEMTAPQLKVTTMEPSKRRLLRVMIAEDEQDRTEERVEHLMGKKPELRFQFIQEQTALLGDSLKQALDV